MQYYQLHCYTVSTRGNNSKHFISPDFLFAFTVVIDDKLSVIIYQHFHDVLIILSTKGVQLLNVQPLWDCQTPPFLCP